MVGGSGGRSRMHLLRHRRETLFWRGTAAVLSLLCSLYYTQAAAYAIDENCKVGKFDLFNNTAPLIGILLENYVNLFFKD